MMKVEMIKRRLVVATGLTALFLVSGIGAASATPDPVADGFTDAGTKVALYGGLLITLVLIGFGIMLGVKYLSKGFRKA